MEISNSFPESSDVLIEIYRDLTIKCEDLAKTFSDRNAPQVLEMYSSCLSEIEELLLLETTPEFTGPLMSIQAQLIWQQQCLRDASSSEGSAGGSKGPATSTSNFGEEKPNFKRRKLNNDESRMASRKTAIQSTLRENLGSGLDEIAGLDGVKSLLRNSVILPMSFPSLFTGGRKPWTQILLFGPPGTGKSKIASALACEAKSQFYSISSADLLSCWVGESEKTIKELFDYTRKSTEKCIVFIDEIDSLCRKRSAREGDHSRSMKNQLLVELDLNLTSNSNCFILCATNCPWDIDIAFMRRFQRRIYIPLPDRDSRLKIIQYKCEDVSLEMSQEDWENVLDKTEGYSGSDMVNITTYALQEPIGEVETSCTWIITTESFSEGKWMPCLSNTLGCFSAALSDVPPNKICVRSVCLGDFLKAIMLTPKTVLKSELEKYTKFISEYNC